MLNKARKTVLALPTKKKLLLGIGFIIILICTIAVLISITQPQRTVANFCRVAKEEKAVLTGDVNYEQRLESYKKLEAVSPDGIRPDITTIRKGYEDILSNPSGTLSTGIGMSGAENRRTAYITKNCPNF